jgi:Secretion system C-terminal sorting domain/PKD domain
MKRILLFCSIFTLCIGFAQQSEINSIKVVGPSMTVPAINSPLINSDRTVTCSNDTLLYNQAKSTGAQGISINNATSAYAFCQYFDAPQDITVYGAQFVAYKPDNVSGDTIQVTVSLYNASADSLPWGAALATITTPVDINNWGFNFDLMRKTAIFNSPVVMNTPYIIAVINNSATPITMYSSDYNAGDGLGENLGSARIGFNWVRGYDVNVGGNPFDADMFFYPIVSYDLDAEFLIDPNCDLLAGTVNTTNWSSPVLFNRFYSSEAFAGTAGSQSTWDWGDASPLESGMNPSHTYGAGVFDVILTDTLIGWGSTCIDDDTLSTCAPPVAAFEISDTLCLINCMMITNNSVRADTYAWTFQGGNPAAFSSMTPDSVCWSAPGTYDIELVVTNSAGTDTMKTTVTIDACGVGFEENGLNELLLYPNPSSTYITLSADENMSKIQIFDMSGKLILDEILNDLQLSNVNIQAIPNGIYAAKVLFEDGTFVNRRLQIVK